MIYDIIIIGAGPAGLCFAKCIADQGLKVAVIEKQPLKTLSNPSYDGREIALTHLSHKIMVDANIWQLIPKNKIALINDAKVMNGYSSYALHFDHKETGKGNLGFMVSNNVIRKAAYDAISLFKNIYIIPETEVIAITSRKNHITLTCSNGETLSSSLIVAADSRFSTTRRMMGISSEMLDFGRTCIVCTMKTERSHDKTAYEMFHYDRTLAVLPLSDHKVSIVITLPADKCVHIMSMLVSDFELDIERRLDGKLGKMHLDSKLFPYPLVATYARQFYADRFALIGDAAVGMHPVTAHGFNLGLRGARTLANEIISTLAKSRDVGSIIPLRSYSDAHRRVSRPIYLGTNALVHLYTNDSQPARMIRSALLHLGNNIGPVRRKIMDQLTEIKAT